MFFQHAVSADGKKYALLARREHGDGYMIEVMEIPTARTIASFPLEVLGTASFFSLRFSPDNSHLLLATSGAIAEIDYRKREVVRNIELRPSKDGINLVHPLMPRSFDFSRNPAVDGPQQWPTAIEKLDGMAVSSTEIIATASVGGFVELWDYRTGRFLESVDNKNLKTDLLTFSDNGERLAYVQDRTVHILDLNQFLPNSRSLKAEPEKPAGK